MKSAIVTYPCWKCSKVCATPKELKNHVLSRPHRLLQVVCAWCYDTEKAFRGAAELRSHVNYLHREEIRGLGERFFLESNCFWFALHPEDYARVISPTDWDSTTAKKAREFVMEWGRRCTRPSRAVEQWRSGWKDTHDNKSPTLCSDDVYKPEQPAIEQLDVQSIEMSSSGAEAMFISDKGWYKVTFKPTLFTNIKAMTSLTRKMMVTKSDSFAIQPAGQWTTLSNNKTLEARVKIARKLDVDINLLDDLVFKRSKRPFSLLNDISPNKRPRISDQLDVGEDPCIFLEAEQADHRVVLNSPISTRSYSSTTAPLTALTPLASPVMPSSLSSTPDNLLRPISAGESSTVSITATESTMMTTSPAVVLPSVSYAPSSVRCSIAVPAPIAFPRSCVAPLLPVSGVSSVMSGSVPSTPVPVLVENSSVIVAPTVSPSKSLETLSANPASVPVNVGLSINSQSVYTNVLSPQVTTLQMPTCVSTYSNPVTASISASSTTTVPSSSLQKSIFTPTTNSDDNFIIPSWETVSALTTSFMSNILSPSASISLPSEPISQPAVTIPHLTAKTLPTEVISSADTDISVRTHMRSATLVTRRASERARELLRWGGMPLFAPGRRNWEIGHITFTVGGKSVVWPPHGWKQMDPDQRLMAWEFLAMRMAADRHQGQLPIVDRSTLMDRFNFLALPGSSTYRTEGTMVVGKARYYTYETLRNISTGTISGMKDWLCSIEASARLRETHLDNLIRKVDKVVPLRLDV